MQFLMSRFTQWIGSLFVQKQVIMPPPSSNLLERFSHELRTSLTGIVGYAEFIETNSTESMVNFTAKIIRESSQGLARASNSFFDLRLLEQGKIKLNAKDFFWDELVRSVVKPYQKEAFDKGAYLVYTCADEVPALQMNSDIQRVRQVVDALVYWACQFVGKGKTVHLDASRDEAGCNISLLFIFLDLTNERSAIELLNNFWNADFYTFRLQEGPGVELALVKALIIFLHGQAEFRFASDELPRLVVTLPLSYNQSKVIHE